MNRKYLYIPLLLLLIIVPITITAYVPITMSYPTELRVQNGVYAGGIYDFVFKYGLYFVHKSGNLESLLKDDGNYVKAVYEKAKWYWPDGQGVGLVQARKIQPVTRDAELVSLEWYSNDSNAQVCATVWVDYYAGPTTDRTRLGCKTQQGKISFITGTHHQVGDIELAFSNLNNGKYILVDYVRVQSGGT